MRVARTIIGIVATVVAIGVLISFYGWLNYIPSHLALASLEKSLRTGMTRDDVYRDLRNRGLEAHAYDPFIQRIEEGSGGWGSPTWPSPNARNPHPTAIVRFQDSGGFCTEGDVDLWLRFDSNDRLKSFEEHRAGSAC